MFLTYILRKVNHVHFNTCLPGIKLFFLTYNHPLLFSLVTAHHYLRPYLLRIERIKYL